MRTNLPITGREFEFSDRATLMSATDADSHITYANAAFLAVSGFTAEELTGQPHNLVRHPDMPPAAFADMWATLRAGRSWTALVKNRRKNGDHYWVRANATPVVREGQIKGYMSVRTRPMPHEVAQAEDLYRAFQSGRAGHLGFHQGLLIRRGWWGLRSWSKTLSTAWRLRLGVLALGAVGLCGTALAGQGGPALLGSLATIALGASVVTMWLERQIVAPLRAIQRQALAVAAGQVVEHVHLDRVDEIGVVMRALNQASLNLRSLVDDVAEQVDGVRAASGEIAQGTDHLSQRTEQSAAALEETASSMEQIRTALQQNASAAHKVAALAAQANEAAVSGSAAMTDCVDTMRGVSSASQRIVDIIGVIDALAFQTNILALNAAVEAARAGEHGRGFNVVATEVRQLAQRSAVSAREIRTLITAAATQVEAGMERVDRAGEMIQDIATQVSRVTQLVGEISVATQQQSVGVTHVHDTLTQLDNMTQQNAALVEQSSAAAQSLQQRADRLAAAVGVFG